MPPTVTQVLTALSVVALLTTACTEAAEVGAKADPEPKASPSERQGREPVTLRRGGRVIFPRYRVVAHYGAADTDELGVLGEGSPRQAARALLRRARAYRSFGRPVMPAMELIATVAQASAGTGGDFSVRSTKQEVTAYLRAVRRIDGLLILDVQPGRSAFMKEVKVYEGFLKEPDVGLALDPEWSMHGGDEPGEAIGWTTAKVINRVSAYLAQIVKEHRLPQKLLVIHEFTTDMVRGKGPIKPRDGVAIIFHIDGFGGRAAKLSKYEILSRKRPFFNGFKLFLDEDVDIFSPREVMRRLTPRPDLITYQ